jgi:hypothetical protein
VKRRTRSKTKRRARRGAEIRRELPRDARPTRDSLLRDLCSPAIFAMGLSRRPLLAQSSANTNGARPIQKRLDVTVSGQSPPDQYGCQHTGASSSQQAVNQGDFAERQVRDITMIVELITQRLGTSQFAEVAADGHGGCRQNDERPTWSLRQLNSTGGVIASAGGTESRLEGCTLESRSVCTGFVHGLIVTNQAVPISLDGLHRTLIEEYPQTRT